MVAACVWKASPELVVALDERFGSPLDAYVNGSQVWIREDGPSREPLEWRLHPVARYRRPEGVGTEELFDAMSAALAGGGQGLAGPLDEVWEGLECFAAYGAELDPAALASACTEALGRPPDAAGLVDHQVVADGWERSNRTTSIIDALLAQLGGPSPGRS